MPQPDWQSIENLAYQIIIDAVHSIRRQHPHETVYAAIFHNFYCDNTYLYFPSLSVGTEELLARVVEKYQSEYGSTARRAELEQSLRWSARIWRNICLTAARRAMRRRKACRLPCAKKPIGTIYTTASANVFRAPAAAPPKICCAPSSSPPIFVAVACNGRRRADCAEPHARTTATAFPRICANVSGRLKPQKPACT